MDEPTNRELAERLRKDADRLKALRERITDDPEAFAKVQGSEADLRLAASRLEREPDGWIEEDEIPEGGRATVTWHSEPNASRRPVYIGEEQGE